jgi:hypothetical protein
MNRFTTTTKNLNKVISNTLFPTIKKTLANSNFVAQEQDIEDIVSQVLEKIWLNQVRYNKEISHNNWFREIAKNTTLDYIKANNKQYKDGISFDEIPTEAKNTMINSTGLFFYIEPDSTISAISDEYFDSFSEYAVTSDFSDEYINPLTFNKLLYQVVHNLMSIKELMMGRFRSATNIDGIIVYDSLVLDDYFDLLKMDRSSNYFVHENETVSIVVNRIFENILTLQEAIIDNMQTIFMSTQTYVNGNTRII